MASDQQADASFQAIAHVAQQCCHLHLSESIALAVKTLEQWLADTIVYVYMWNENDRCVISSKFLPPSTWWPWLTNQHLALQKDSPLHTTAPFGAALLIALNDHNRHFGAMLLARSQPAGTVADPWSPIDRALAEAIAAPLALRASLDLLSSQDSIDRRWHLQPQNELLAQAINVISDGLEITNAKDEFEFVNPAFEKLTGYSQAEVLGKTAAEVLRSDFHAPEYYQQIGELLASGKPWRGQLVSRHKSGQLIYQEATAQPILDDQGQITHIVGVRRDITQQYHAEAALRQSEAELRALFGAISDTVIVLDRQGRYLKILSAHPGVLYQPMEQILSRTLHEVLPQDKADEFLGYIQQVLDTQTTLRVEYYLPINGRDAWFSTSISPFGDDQTLWMIRDTTSRHLAEAKLARSEARFRSLIQNSSDIISLLDAEGNTLEHSPSITRILGYEVHELIGNNAFNLVHPDDRPNTLAAFKTHLQTKQPITIEYRFRCRDGGWRFLESTATNLIDDPNVGSIVVNSRDISDRKQAEANFARQVQQDQLVAELTLKIRQTLDLKTILSTTVQEVSHFLQADRVLIYQLLENGDGQVVTETVVEGFPTVLHQAISDRCFREDYGDYYAQGGTTQIDDIYAKDLDPCHVKFLEQFKVRANLVVPIFQNNTLWGLLIAHQCRGPRSWSQWERELLQRVANSLGIALLQAQLIENLKKSESEFRQIFETSPISIGLMRISDFTFERANPAWYSLLGYTAEEVPKLRLSDITHPEDLDLDEQATRCMVDDKQPYFQIEKRYIKKNGQTVFGLLTAALMYDDQGKPAYTLGMIEDISDRKRVETEIRKALDRERELSALRSRFVAMASHEFRTPLATIAAATNLLTHFSEKLNPRERHDRLKKIRAEVDHLTSLLDDLLLINQAESGQIVLAYSAINLSEFCSSVLESIRLGVGRAHNFTLARQGSPRPLRGDRTLLRQVLLNLLSNAVKYSPAGSTVHLQLQFLPNHVVIQVHDQGIGIPKEEQDQLFSVFYRASNTTSNIKGTGLGLFIVQRIVELHGGTITFESEVGVGSVFIISIPD